MNKLVSIGLPVYNGEDYLEETLKSLLDQTFGDFEIVISDNASTDRTKDICMKYAALDSRIKYSRNERNLGAAKNYNKVFHETGGKYFKWASHDDLYDPTYLEKCVKVLETNPNVALVYTSRVVIDQTGREEEKISNELKLVEEESFLRYKKFLRIFRYSTIYCDPVFGLIRRDILAKTNLIGNYPTSDMNLLGEIALRGEFYEIEEYLFFRRRHPKMSAKANPGMRNRAIWFDPDNKNKILLTRWRWLKEFLSAIKKTELRKSEKLLCYFETIKWGIFRWRGLSADIYFALKYKFSGNQV